MLQKGIISVKFTKVDGTERTMRCTLNESYIKPHDKKTDKEKAANNNIMSVWDIDKDSWRSFRVDSVIEIYK
jgi:WYL_2, Sm-like SH3 beta-barrel fold